jgi:hypothetical protein
MEAGLDRWRAQRGDANRVPRDTFDPLKKGRSWMRAIGKIRFGIIF